MNKIKTIKQKLEAFEYTELWCDIILKDGIRKTAQNQRWSLN
jgi:hypothetical protein